MSIYGAPLTGAAQCTAITFLLHKYVKSLNKLHSAAFTEERTLCSPKPYFSRDNVPLNPCENSLKRCPPIPISLWVSLLFSG